MAEDFSGKERRHDAHDSHDRPQRRPHPHHHGDPPGPRACLGQADPLTRDKGRETRLPALRMSVFRRVCACQASQEP